MIKKTQYTTILVLIYMLGIFAFFKECEILTSAVVFFVTMFLLFKKFIPKGFALGMVFVFIFGVVFSDLKMKSDDILKSLAPLDITLTGQVVSIPTSNFPDKTKFFLNVHKADTGFAQFDNIKSKTFVTLNDTRENYQNIKIGDEIKIKTKLRIPQDSTNPSQFSYRNYLKNFNTFTTSYVTLSGWEIVSSPQTVKWKFIQKLNILRHKIISKHARIIKTPNLEILGGIVFGDDAISPPEDIKNSFIHSGLMHILAASGLNVALIFGIWFFFSRRFRLPYRFCVTSGIFIILFYTMMTGLGPPVLRAALMLTFALIGKLINRDADNISLLFFVAGLILIYNPAFLFDVGFQLSFIVTYALLLFCPLAAEKTKKIPQSIAGAIYVPLIAQFAVAPIQMYYFNNFALYSLFANIASLPFVSAISFLGFSSSILAMIPKFPDFILSAFDIIMNPILTILVNISNFFSNLPNALLTVPQCNIFQIFLYYLLLILLFFLFKNDFGKKLLSAVCTVLIVLILSAVPIKNSNLEAIFFNVGNADAILVKTPDNKYSLIDTAHQPYQGGFTQAKAIIYEYLKDRNIKELEYLIITHYDADHAGGATTLINLIKIKNLVLNPNPSNSKLYDEIHSAARTKNINIIYPEENPDGTYLKKEKDFYIKIYEQPKNTDNNSSIITLFSQNGRNILLTGDAEAKIVEQFNLPDKIDILKVGHHGASKTTTENFLITKHVKTAILSTGPNNYGHPAPDTVYNLQKTGTKIMRTDTDNAIKIVVTDNSVKEYSYSSKKKKWERLGK